MASFVDSLSITVEGNTTNVSRALLTPSVRLAIYYPAEARLKRDGCSFFQVIFPVHSSWNYIYVIRGGKLQVRQVLPQGNRGKEEMWTGRL